MEKLKIVGKFVLVGVSLVIIGIGIVPAVLFSK